MVKIYSAPLQGYTNAPWRHFHANIYGGADGYFSPFLRAEKGEVRRHDLKDITSDLNGNHSIVPQIIFRDMAEFNLLVETVIAQGYKSVNLNMGCPFPPQVKHGRGSAVILNIDLLRTLKSAMDALPEVSFSVKMRLGVDNPKQWTDAIGLLNSMPLEHITLHPRTAQQQYTGELYLDQFEDFMSHSAHKVIFNGDITSPDDITAVVNRSPSVYGVMIGRGLLSRPSLIQEYRSGEEWSNECQIAEVLNLHQSLYDYYRDIACGDSQFLSQLKPFWTYLEPLIGHKSAKLIKKATTINKYNAAITNISR